MPGGDGNISVRISSNMILITPSYLPKGSLKASQIVLVDKAGKVLEGDEKPSSELIMHLTAYERRKDISAVVHAHPPYITALSVAGKSLPSFVLAEATLKLGNIVELGYALPSTRQTAELLSPYLTSANTFVLKNHGSVTLGRDIDEAVMRTEVLEHFGKVLFYASLLGRIETIPEAEREALLRMRENI